ncbi:MAG: TIGR03943 family putative permease subunit [Chloroflexota bacterium]
MTIRAADLRARGVALRLDIARYLPALILAGYGIFILSLYLRNDLTLYINPSYVLPTTLAGSVLLLLSIVSAVRQRLVSVSQACDCDDGCCTDAPRKVWPYLVLVIPLALAVLFPPRGLAAFSALQRGPQAAGLGTVHATAAIHHVSLSVDTRQFTMSDWVGALSADPNPKDYKGKPVIVSGLVVHNPAMVPPGYFMVLRYQVTCCIADARPVGLIVKDTSHGAIADNTWVTVTGAMGATTYQNQQMTVVETQKIQRTKAQSPYIY